ncbi:MAG TPA: hypothetical protein VGP82_25790 [Ktedonobacterales bacterium]|nr:hypothetical protein [Ktedonobacterales bacterium]
MPSAQYPLLLELDTLLPIRPRARKRLAPSPRWEPGPALVPLLVAAPALLAASIFAAQSAPTALRLLAALNVPAAMRELTWPILAAGLGIIGATLAMLLLAGHGTRRPVGGRAWASQHLEHAVQARQGWVRRAPEPVVVVRRQNYRRGMPAITPLPFWDASEALPRSIPSRMGASLLTQKQQAHTSGRKTTRKLSASQEYLPLLPMPA